MIDEEDKIPFMEHLGELRDRLIRCFIAIGIGFLIAYYFKEKIFAILTAPLVSAMGKGSNMIFTGLPEAFFTYLKVSLLAGLIIALPVVFYEFWMFISPGLYRKERKFLVPIVLLSLIFFVVGACFGYFVVFPFGFRFFLGFSTESIKAMPSMKEYLGFASKMLLAFGLVFELPLIMTFLARMGLVSVDFLRKNRKYAILIIFTVSAILTPPDVATQLMMAGPLMVLFEISILGARIFQKKKEDFEEESENEDQDQEKPDKKKKAEKKSEDKKDSDSGKTKEEKTSKKKNPDNDSANNKHGNKKKKNDSSKKDIHGQENTDKKDTDKKKGD